MIYIKKHREDALKGFYVYVYLDPRKPGNYCYDGEIIFEYEPFYVGKGRKKRYLSHLKEQKKISNKRKVFRIRKITEEGKEPIIVLLEKQLTESCAYKKEQELIRSIGRIDLRTGPLTNKTNGGYALPTFTTFQRLKFRVQQGLRMTKKNREVPIEEQKRRHAKGSATTKRLGLLKGENHPCFGKPNSKKRKAILSKRHTGAGNSHAKKWEAISPAGERYLIQGVMKRFCIEHKLSYATVMREKNKGSISARLTSKVTDLSSNTVGWKITELQ